MQLPTAATLWRAAASFALGLVAGTIGTVMHRAVRPWGLVLCVLLVLVIVLIARAWCGWFGYGASAGGALLAIQVLATGGPGGDVLVPAGDLWGWGWVGGAVLAVIVVGLVPRRWVTDDGPTAP
ncbi:hypothetical protein J1G42_15820 [Cellulomonas sp. zg-ZUI222]|uniref:Uncharacterized protein n=1 Tax=Cellulomonas wangleii TaxID=2816956 RepID=A0ABX8DBJ3_9CELL|nr:hypothetical protein [Cellulomonas wangleii]MBO0922289.1 hypothetical protein [Cellulomonas wangleii]MBO0925984.1 hypothetical protein [Cellulomonas wangleii]QVI63282.1 hypothetical protein KG103_05155 [Cellulomonas wangleii]